MMPGRTGAGKGWGASVRVCARVRVLACVGVCFEVTVEDGGGRRRLWGRLIQNRRFQTAISCECICRRISA